MVLIEHDLGLHRTDGGARHGHRQNEDRCNSEQSHLDSHVFIPPSGAVILRRMTSDASSSAWEITVRVSDASDANH